MQQRLQLGGTLQVGPLPRLLRRCRANAVESRPLNRVTVLGRPYSARSCSSCTLVEQDQPLQHPCLDAEQSDIPPPHDHASAVSQSPGHVASTLWPCFPGHSEL
jgi:hypothetical protein